MITHKIVQLSPKPYGVHLITNEILNKAELSGSGVLHLFIQHTSAALALNENASPDVLTDVHQFFCDFVPENRQYRHKEEGPDDMPAHIKSIICGASLSIPYLNNSLLLGVWQGIYLMEFRRNAGTRNIVLSLLS
ncbi:secondary thiamine-phosphate synthase enzyme YjbQ [Legionella bononiensis]|uniref:YjbQ family protein n=1 Tax=Legionella bononiensis TaxID=2793102 RepID=A0ABS1W714_9GAMM|nr:secondary thiamine-phosphate synthase enzyme YjbQ [Legionella bononiensis]MBL7481261.1 YjbQ family protein [Legionella bononiensis]MBL7525166.1 YjbQ family protein [Legionella bononiensis]MBL7562890.1 YjbQ family protein [Legionella bononiensis]